MNLCHADMTLNEACSQNGPGCRVWLPAGYITALLMFGRGSAGPMSSAFGIQEAFGKSCHGALAQRVITAQYYGIKIAIF